MTRTRFLLILLAAHVLLSADLPGAQRTFVSAANGSDGNPCTRALPCRNFTAAIPQTDPGGEVIVLDSGGFGVVTITQSISLISPSGVYAGITAFGDDAVTVLAGDAARVVLRNLDLNALGGEIGIDADTVGALYVADCVVSGFELYGIRFDPVTSGAGARLYVSDSTIRQSGTAGIRLFGGTGIRATINSVELHQNFIGVHLLGAEATIRDSVASGGANAGFLSENASKAWIENSVATYHGRGFYAADNGVITMTRCATTSNTAGIEVFDSGTVYVSDSTIVGNVTGLSFPDGGVIISRVNNTLRANTNNGSFSSTYLPE